jgi:glucose-1-phosphate thymidylyltransferase
MATLALVDTEPQIDTDLSDPRLSTRTEMTRKGIVLAGGTGNRLYPITSVVNKQLLPVYDKPLVYYPISTLMLAGIRDILIITTPRGQPGFEGLLGDGSAWGVRFSYEVQPNPEGIAQAFLIGERFLDGDPCALVLGDNIFFGANLVEKLESANVRSPEATVFGYRVEHPEAYGVLSFDPQGRVTGIVEKPDVPPSSFAVTGLYFFDGEVSKLAATLEPSGRGELEITDLNRLYLERGELNVELLGRGFAWLDAGTPESLLAASDFVRTLELRQGMKASCPEEVAFRMGFIDAAQLARLADAMGDHVYARYLLRLADEPVWEMDGARIPTIGPGTDTGEP